MCMNSIQELVTLLLRQGNMSIECEYHLLSILLSKGSVIGIATVACNKKYFLKHDTGIMIILYILFFRNQDLEIAVEYHGGMETS